MSVAAKETSSHSAAPIELYVFQVGRQIWRYTAGAEDVAHNSISYKALTLERSEIAQTGEFGRQNLIIKLDPKADLIQEYIAQPPAQVMTVAISRLHQADGPAVTLWQGRVLNVEWKPGVAELRAEPVYTSLQRTGLRRLYQRNCPHVLYEPACGADRKAYVTRGKVASVTGHTIAVIEAAANAAGYFAGGYAEWDWQDNRTERRMITAHSGRSLTLTRAGGGLAAGLAIELYPGCDRTLATCHAKFTNSVNYGGFPWIPQKNPFGGVAVY